MRPGEVYMVKYPKVDGHEQAGSRPGVVLQDDARSPGSPLVLTIPFTSTSGVTRYPAVVPVTADANNGLTTNSLAMVFQLRATDRRRFLAKLGEVSPAVLAEIYAALDKLTGRP